MEVSELDSLLQEHHRAVEKWTAKIREESVLATADQLKSKTFRQSNVPEWTPYHATVCVNFNCLYSIENAFS